ncbi:methylenetetrahydrofolate reductase [Prauserella muralis]|uniref:Methylenetetrahydrofolate reductase n=1 Tax=Prauserella muralis TaxID=588067 RepID=A0A2V4B2C1_9PSEU|nr:methylenetetrahydrofolate reductase [Prauserella muralis]PXY22705.1 5,10-methylenetetrahydrofolate reductase [Prauserella muralis]TWE28423.1 methylenetetrahydrofolate reductase (NADPH) [Prauserella muralis]
MTLQQEVAGRGRRRAHLADLVRNISYEVMPFKNTERDVVATVPVSVPLTVTVTEAKGIDTTLALTERLLGHGYSVAPHLPARQFANTRHVGEVVDRLREAGVRSVFVVGGDAPEPVGEFADAHALLQAMEAHGHPFTEVGIGGYPEGHARIPQEAIDLALKQKAPLATRVITQICFDATTTSTWAARIAACGVGLDVHVGMPGPVNRQKLMRISAGIGLGQSARFLQKQRSLAWRFLMPGGYNPTKLAKRLGAAVPRTDSNIRGLHIFTFNELAGTERWRRSLLASIGGEDRR